MKRLLLAAAVLGLAALVMKKMCAQQRGHWQGLSETDAREKLDHRLPSRIPDERRAAMTDKIIGRMRDRGAIVDDTDVGDDAKDNAGEKADDTVDLDLTAPSVETDDVTTTVKA